MPEELEKIKNIIKYLNRVSKSEEIGLMDQDFFLTTEELKRLIDNYYLGFNNQKELNEELRFRYNSITELKFKEGDFFRIRDLTNNKKVRYNNEEHQAYAFNVWRFLINEFETKLNLKVKEKQSLSIKNKRVFKLFELIDSEIEIFSSGEDFINATVNNRNQTFHLNIDNRKFYYIITVLKPYFYNFEYQKFVLANQIYTKRGGRLRVKNFHNAKVDHPSKRELIDEIVNNFINSLD
tara:strand:+ start:263 stop:973 length:711 start_codon:yes stop_codon:yes gene_type:complete